MTIKINVGLSRKVGQPNFGSLGASCHVDIELDAQLLRDEPDRLRAKVREAFAVCKQSVDAELASSSQFDETPQGFAPPITGPSSWLRQDDAPPEPRRGSGVARPATPAQVKAIHAIAGKAGIVVASELQRRFGVSSPQQLNISQASQMIDHLKASLTPVPA
jgi:hypothetical protein